MEDVILVLPFNQPVKHIRVLCDHVQQLRVTGVGTEPAAVSPAVSVDWGKHPVFLTELVGVNLGHTVFGKQTDLRYSIQTSKAFWLILRDAEIAHSVRRECGIVLADWRDFAVTIDCTHTSPCKAANLALVRSAGDDMMEHLIVGLVRVENGELDAQLLFAEGLEPVINEVPVFRDSPLVFLSNMTSLKTASSSGSLCCAASRSVATLSLPPLHEATYFGRIIDQTPS